VYLEKFPAPKINTNTAVNNADIQGAPIKNNPLAEIRYLWNCRKFCRQIYSVYNGGFSPHILQISLRNFAEFKNYNYLNLNVHFSK